MILVYLSVAFSVWSGANYFRAFLAMLSTRGSGSSGSGAAVTPSDSPASS